jgi:hypothetical protein
MNCLCIIECRHSLAIPNETSFADGCIVLQFEFLSGNTSEPNIHVQRLRNQGKRVPIGWIKGHNGNTGNERADAFAGRAIYNIALVVRTRCQFLG